jgi:hypothetical protein
MLNITGFISKFLNRLQDDTQKRFIEQAKKKGEPKNVTIRLTKIEKEVETLRKILKDL